MEEVFGGVYFGVVVVVGSSLGAEPEPNDHEPWITPAAVLPPAKFLKRPSVRSRPLPPQPGHSSTIVAETVIPLYVIVIEAPQYC